MKDKETPSLDIESIEMGALPTCDTCEILLREIKYLKAHLSPSEGQTEENLSCPEVHIGDTLYEFTETRPHNLFSYVQENRAMLNKLIRVVKEWA